MAIIEQLANAIQVCALPVTAAEHYGDIRAALQKQGQPIGNNDLWLAACMRGRRLDSDHQ
ncbi:hypothetical protein LP416_17065 [Polaromonas sp. P2-4]|nr:hypothetical protein LP416_17065 [Polaromonas sp. P2-4]